MGIEKKYHGAVIPLVTPLTENFALDEAAVEKIMTNTQSGGCLPFILGTTGEAASLSLSVKKNYIKKAVALKDRNSLLYAGVGSNCLEDAVELSKYGFDAGVDVVVATVPSYFMLSDDQVKKYFQQLADSIDGPLIMYNIPATTHHSISLQVIEELSHHQNIVGIKDSERNEERIKQSLQLWAKRTDFSYFLGWAARSAEALLHGGDGIVPSTGNLDPSLYTGLMKHVANGDTEGAKRAQKVSDDIGNIYQAGKSMGESLAALKVLMKSQKLCEPYMMPPLQRLSAEEEKKLIAAYDAIVI